MSGLTRRLAEFCAAPRPVPDDVAPIVKRGFVDAVATMVAGRDEPAVAIVRRFVAARESSAREARVLLGRSRVASADAALVNATATHALDYDDVALGGHPSAVLVPAILAEGEAIDASGADAIAAYLVGYETWAELAAREPDAYHEKGWHPTAVLGTVAAAAAIAHLRRLPAAIGVHALALASSMASGLVANFGTMAKPLHAGRAACGAIDAVRLAIAGLTGAVDAIEHPSGYLGALSPRGRADRSPPAAPIGSQLRIREAGLSIKRYPVCYSAHRAIDGVLDLAARERLRADDVREVRLTLGPAAAAMLRNHAPVTALEAKFSAEFAVAAAVIAGGVGLKELDDGFVGDARVRRLMDRVRIDIVDSRCPIEPVFALTDRVVVTLADGRRLDSGPIRFPRGNAKRPLSSDELEAKFRDCTRRLAPRSAERLYGALVDLDTVASLRRLPTLVRQPSSRAARRPPQRARAVSVAGRRRPGLAAG